MDFQMKYYYFFGPILRISVRFCVNATVLVPGKIQNRTLRLCSTRTKPSLVRRHFDQGSGVGSRSSTGGEFPKCRPPAYSVAHGRSFLKKFYYTLRIIQFQLDKIIFFCVIEILLSLMCSRMVLMVVCWRYGMLFDANGCVSTLINVDWIKWMYFCVNEFEVGVNDNIFSGNEQQKV